MGDWTGKLKVLGEESYGKILGVWTVPSGWVSGCSVRSVASASRRAYAVIFSASVTEPVARMAQISATNLSPDTINTVMNEIKASNSTYSSLALPFAASVAATTVSSSSNGGGDAASIDVIIGVAVAVMVTGFLLVACLLFLVRWHAFGDTMSEAPLEPPGSRSIETSLTTMLDSFPPGAPPPGYSMRNTRNSNGDDVEKSSTSKEDSLSFSSQFIQLVRQNASGPLAEKAEDYAERLVANGIDDWFVIGAVSYDDLRLLDIPLGHARAILALVGDADEDDEPAVDTAVVDDSAAAGVYISSAISTGTGMISPPVMVEMRSGGVALDNLPFESGVAQLAPLPQQGAFESDDGAWSTEEEGEDNVV